MKTVGRFIWFTTHSWSYLKGQRLMFFRDFLGAWKDFNEASKRDEEKPDEQ